ncbi:MAG: hypothetical protein ABW185_07775, partial [Sedimenticola sp.]
MTELDLEFIFLEVDQAIYNKVLQVIFKYKEDGSARFDNVIVRMGGFHIIMCLMKSIYSRFNGSGLVELLSEAGVGAEGTIKAGLNGSNVKQGIRYYKLLFEAILRSKLDFLDNGDVHPATTDIPIHELPTAINQSSEGVCTTPSTDIITMYEETNNLESQTQTQNQEECHEEINSSDPPLESDIGMTDIESDTGLSLADRIACLR